MGYWKWLKAWIFPGRIKNILIHPYAEYIYGLVAGIIFLLFGLALGLGNNHLYFLLILGLIPSILVSLHGIYRQKLERR